MKFPVFSHSSNPAIDRPIISKSKTYLEQQVLDGLADWVDPLNHRLGIQCRAVEDFTKPRTSRTGEHLPHMESKVPITWGEEVRNAVGVADKGKRRLFASELRAMAKVKAWPEVFDTKAVRVGPSPC